MSLVRRRSRLTRPVMLVATVIAMLIAVSGPVAADVPPEHQVGQIGHYLVNDSSDAPLVNCRYASPSPYKLNRFLAKPPLAWWSDTDSNNDDEQGTVGWQVVVQQATQPEGPWSDTFSSTIVKSTAHEDSASLFDPATSAAFTKRVITWNRTGRKLYRIVYKLTWYNPDASVQGSLTHWIDRYHLVGAVVGAGQGYCFNKINAIP